MKYTQIRANTQVTERLKQLIDVRGNKESMAAVINELVGKELNKYGFTQDGYVKSGDTIQLADENRNLTDEVQKIINIINDDVLLSDGSLLHAKGRILFFSKIVNRGV